MRRALGGVLGKLFWCRERESKLVRFARVDGIAPVVLLLKSSRDVIEVIVPRNLGKWPTI